MNSQLSLATVHRDAFQLLREYAALVPARSVSFPDYLSFTELNSFLIDFVLSNAHFKTYSPSKQYQRTFWKTLISWMEDKMLDNQDEEIDCRILDHYLSLLPPSGPHAGSTNPDVRDQTCGLGLPAREIPSKSFLTHFWKFFPEDTLSESEHVDLSQYQTLTLHESRTTIESGTTGLRTWVASHTLSQFLIKHPEFVQGKCVLELGCGIGFLGIVVASLQLLSNHPSDSSQHAGSIWLTDVNEDVLSQCHYNVQLSCNLSANHTNVHYRTLDWSEALEPDVSALEHLLRHEIDPDIILGADIVFDPSLVSALIAELKLALSADKERFALISLTIRNTETYQHFLNIAMEQSLVIEDLEFNDNKPMFLDTVEGGGSLNKVKILRITLNVHSIV